MTRITKFSFGKCQAKPSIVPRAGIRPPGWVTLISGHSNAETSRLPRSDSVGISNMAYITRERGRWKESSETPGNGKTNIPIKMQSKFNLNISKQYSNLYQSYVSLHFASKKTKPLNKKSPQTLHVNMLCFSTTPPGAMGLMMLVRSDMCA